jgi:hypothetical protein
MTPGGALLRTSVLLSFCLAIILLVSYRAVNAQSLNHKAHELFNLLEYLYPEILSPSFQATREGKDTFSRAYFYRSYSDSDIELRAYPEQGRLYLLHAQDEYDLGELDTACLLVRPKLYSTGVKAGFQSCFLLRPRLHKWQGKYFTGHILIPMY